MKRKPIILAAEAWSDDDDAWTLIDFRKLPWNNDLAYVLGVEGAWLASHAVSEHLKKRIRKNRGLPSNASTDAETLLAATDHQSWLTSAELLAYPWETQVDLCGYVGPADYAHYQRTGYLGGSLYKDRSSRGDQGPTYLDSIGAIRLTNAEMDEALVADPAIFTRDGDPHEERRYTVVEVTQPLARALGFAETLQWARGLAASHDLRLVVGN